MKKSKKFLALLLGVLVLFNLSACNCYDVVNFFYDLFTLPATVEEIHVYTTSGEELIGEYVEAHEYKKSKSQTTAIAKRSVEPLNSAAPIRLYYVLDAEVGDEIIVEYKVHMMNRKRLKKAVVQSYVQNDPYTPITSITITDIKNEKGGNYTFRVPFTVDGGDLLRIKEIFNSVGKSGYITTNASNISRGVVAFNKPDEIIQEETPPISPIVYDIDFTSQHPWIDSSPDLVKNITVKNTEVGSSLVFLDKYYEIEDKNSISQVLSFFKTAKATNDVKYETKETDIVITYQFAFKDGTKKTLTFYCNPRCNYYIDGEIYAIKNVVSLSRLFSYHYRFVANGERARVTPYLNNNVIGTVDFSLFKFVPYDESKDGKLPPINYSKRIKTERIEIIFYNDRIFSVYDVNSDKTYIYKLIVGLTFNDLLV